MSFLAPLFIIGALAIAAPIIFHLIRRTSKDRTPFSSLMFLEPTPPRVTRKSRLENILLLILRCLVLALLALAFARPFLRNPLIASNTKDATTRTVVLIDSSASMRRDNLWDDAKARALEIIRAATPADEVAVYAFDRNVRGVVGFDEWKKVSANERRSMGEQRINSLKPTWNNTHFGNALLGAVEALEAERDSAAANRRVVLITDLQEGARLDGLQGFQWPKQTQVSVIQVKAKKPTNAGAQLVVQPSAVGLTETVRVRVNNSSESKQEQFFLRWSGTSSNPVAAYVPPGQSRTFDLPKAPDSDTVELTGDESDFDNRVYAVQPPREQIEIAFIGNDNETNTQQLLFYLKRAFPETAQREVQVTSHKPDAAIVTASRNPGLFVVGAQLSGEALADIRRALTNGASVMCVVRQAGEAETLGALLGTSATASESTVSGYAMLSQIDFTHPIFAPFADARFSDFTKIHFWKTRKLELGTTNAQILARFDNGSPALAQVNVGKGTVFALAAGWHPGDSQLALSSKFVPLLFAVLELSGAIKAQALDFHIGDTVDISSLRATNAVSVRKPDGTTASVAAGVKSFTETDLPGVYSVAAEPPLRFGVNLAPEESRTAPLGLEQLEKLGVPVKVQAAATPEQIARREAQMKAAELESRQKLWRWLIVATLVVLVVETWVASRASRRAPVAA